LTEAEGAFLYALAARGPQHGAIVEIGSNRGKSTALLARAAKSGGRERVHAIDPHRGGTEAEFRANLVREGLDDWVVPHVAKHAGLRITRRLYLSTRRKGVPGDLRKACKRMLRALSRPPSTS
jgi:predicted O-methyltransferase YrrM